MWAMIKDCGFPVYSYRVDCVKCVDYRYNWLKYIAVAYLPLNVFLMGNCIFKISANFISIYTFVITFPKVNIGLCNDSW